MKLMVRVSVFALCLAGAVASSFIPKTSASTSSVNAAASTMVVSSAYPLPNCNLGTSCGLGLK